MARHHPLLKLQDIKALIVADAIDMARFYKTNIAIVQNLAAFE